jgi:hypothetical protein
MIRLTIKRNIDPEIHLFNQSVVLLGSDSGQVDLTIAETGIQAIHLKIMFQEGLYILVNVAKDPFVTINGYSFGKKLLHSGDRILINTIPILFEKIQTQEEVEKSTVPDVPAPQETILEAEAPIFPFISFELPFENEVGVFQQQQEPLKVIPELEEKIKVPVEKIKEKVQVIKQPEPVSKLVNSLKDDYLQDLEDDKRARNGDAFTALEDGNHLYQAWKWVLGIIFCLFTIAGAVGSFIYFTVSDKSEAQETKAAQAVADIAVGLTYAQLNDIKPFNQNWSDVDFLKTNLQAVLPEGLSHASQIDAQGQLNCCPYSLRIYTNSALSRFLLIAQPAPSILFWIIPQSIIVLDSELMELHMLSDVRALNRLLTNPDPLDGVNGKEIAGLVKQSPFIRLATLAQDSGHPEFAPPKNLAWIRPGAENLIYNAPRYYRLGQHIAEKAISLSTAKGSSKDVMTLKKNVKNVDWLHNLVLYAEQGRKAAMLMRQGLMMFAPSDHLLFGYLHFNAQGKIYQVHLLKEEEAKDPLSGADKENEMIAYQNPNEMQNNLQPKKNGVVKEIDRNHPVYIQLHSLVTARETELKPLMASLSSLMQQELQYPKSRSQFEFQNLSHGYLMANHKHKKAIRMTLESLYKQYENIPMHEFFQFVKELHLDQLIQNQQTSLAIIDENCQQNMELLLEEMKSCKTLTELDSTVHTAMSWLHFDFFPEPADLIKYQNLLRNELLTQLESFLLSDKKNFKVKSEKREMLERILSQERLIKPEEKAFFIEEFESLLLSQFAQPISDNNE